MPARRGRLLLSLLLLPAALLLWLRTSRTGGGPHSGPDAVDLPLPAAPPPTLPSDSQRELATSLPGSPPAPTPVVRIDVPAAQTLAPTIPWFGRVLDWSTGAPLAGARLVRQERGNPEGITLATSASDGYLEHQLDGARRSTRVELDGHEPTDVDLDAGHATPGQARLVRLVRNASLHVTILDASGALASASLALTGDIPSVSSMDLFRGSHSFRKLGLTTEGNYTFEDVPAGVELGLNIESGLARRHLLLGLDPGEQRELLVDLGDACTVRGEARDPAGAPLAALEVWCLAAELSSGRFTPSQGERATARGTTDELGRFVLEGIPPGTWWIGPEPEKRTAGSLEPAISVALAPGERERFVALTCSPGATIRGRVVGPDGDPARAIVEATRPGIRLSAFTENEGAFVLGPMPSGPWMLTADLTMGAGAPGPPVLASTGDEDVLLRLVDGASLAGEVRAVQGSPSLWVSLVRSGPWESFQFTSGADFEFGGLAPGTYALFAQGSNRVALGGPYTLQAGERRAGLVLDFEEAGELCLRGVEASASTQLRFGLLGQELWLMAPSGLGCHLLPPGPVRVRLVRSHPEGSSVLAEAEAHLTPGTETWLDLR